MKKLLVGGALALSCSTLIGTSANAIIGRLVTRSGGLITTMMRSSNPGGE